MFNNIDKLRKNGWIQTQPATDEVFYLSFFSIRFLTLSPLESITEACNVVLTFEFTNPCGVTIQLKPICQCFGIVPLLFKYFTK